MPCDSCVAYGADATVHLSGSYAWKRFHDANVFRHELEILQQIPSNKLTLRLLEDSPPLLTLKFPRYKSDLMSALIAEEEISAQPCCDGLLAAVRFCHGIGLVHRDIKPENVLIDEVSEPVLCDFARSLFVTEPQNKNFEGTLYYAAPEALDGVCWLSNDVWALGLTLFCLVERKMPFDWEEGCGKKAPEYESCAWQRPYEGQLRCAIESMIQPDYTQRTRLDGHV